VGERSSSGNVKVKGGFRVESRVKMLKQHMIGIDGIGPDFTKSPSHTYGFVLILLKAEDIPS
jgi:hypothetical protein